MLCCRLNFRLFQLAVFQRLPKSDFSRGHGGAQFFSARLERLDVVYAHDRFLNADSLIRPPRRCTLIASQTTPALRGNPYQTTPALRATPPYPRRGKEVVFYSGQ